MLMEYVYIGIILIKYRENKMQNLFQTIMTKKYFKV